LKHRQATLDVVEQLYSDARWFCTFDSWPSDEDEFLRFCAFLFDELCLLVEKKSSPGYPAVWEGISTNRELLENPRARAQAQFRFVELCRCLRHGVSLPKPVVRLFVKPEPHKIEKIRDGRLRLIWSIPFEYQLIHRLFFGPSLAAELANFRSIPTKGGMSWCHGGAHQIYSTLYDPGCDQIADCDKKGWDLSAAAWTIEMERDSRWRLCVNPNVVWKHAFWACYESLLLVRVIFSDGTMCEQKSPGIVKSGSMITLSGNSRMQVILKVLFCIETVGYFDEEKHRIIAIGDDSLERMRGLDPKKYEEWLVHYGYTCKEISVGPLKTRTFCSHTFLYHRGVYVPIPVNWDKHRYALCYKEQGKLQFFGEQLFSLSFEYCFDDEKFGELRKAMLLRGEISKCWSQELLQSFMSGQEASAHPTQVVSQDFERTFQMALDGSLLRSFDQVRGLKFPPAPRLVGVEENPGPDFLLVLRIISMFVAAMAIDGFFGPVVRDATELWLLELLLLFGLLLVVGQVLQLEHVHPLCSSLLVLALLLVQVVNPTLACETTRVSAYELFATDTIQWVERVQAPFGFPSEPLTGAGLAVLGSELKSWKRHLKFGEPSYKPSKGRRLPHYISANSSSLPEKSQSAAVVVAEMQKKKNGGGLKKGTKTEVVVIKGGIPRQRPKFTPKKQKRPNRMNLPGGGRNGMDRTVVSGSDYIQALHVTGPASAGQQILEQPGQVLYKVQLQPFKMIPNSRLKKMMDLFEKWKALEFEFEIRSNMADTNSGTVLCVYEPNALEVVPDVTVGTAAEDQKSLSKYEAHSNVKIMQMSKSKDGKGFHFRINISLQKGPFDGYYFNDPDGSEPLQNTSFGQFFIMLQGPLNCLGSAATGAYTASQDIVWADLRCHYTIECSVASDENDTFLSDPPFATGQIAHNTGDYYSNPLSLPIGANALTFDEVGFTGYNVIQAVDNVGLFFEQTITPSATDSLAITFQEGSPARENGAWLSLRWTVQTADMGTTQSGATETHSSGSIPIVVTRGTTASTATNNSQALSWLIAPGDPTFCAKTGPWVVGTGASATSSAGWAFIIMCEVLPWSVFHPGVQRRLVRAWVKPRKSAVVELQDKVKRLERSLERSREETKEEKKDRTVLVIEEEKSPSGVATLSEPKSMHWALVADRSRRAASLKA